MTDLESLPDGPPAVSTVSDLVRLRAQTHPDHEVLRFDDQTTTYRILDSRATMIGRGLTAMGVGRGHRVAVLLDNSVYAIEAWVALARLHVVEVPLNPALRGESLAFPLRSVVLVDDGHEVSGPNTVSYSSLLQPTPTPTPRNRLAEPAGDDPGREASVIMFSSGTTGAPKGVVLTHAANFLVSMLVNATAVVHRRFSASTFWSACRQEGVTAFNYMGTMSALLLAQPARDDDRDHGVRKAYGSGTVGALKQQFRSRFGVTMVETYGSTELGMSDIVVADETASFALPEIKSGIMPGPGLVNRLVKPGRHRAEADRLAGVVSKYSSVALSEVKRYLNGQVPSQFDYVTASLSFLFGTEEARRGAAKY